MSAQPVDVLAVMDDAAFRIDNLREVAGFEPSELPAKVREARAAVAELVEAAREVADEYMGLAATTKYDGEDDEAGVRACCDVVSYEEHAADCPAVRLRAALARVQGPPATPEPQRHAARQAVPRDFPVRPLKPGQAATDRATCGTCGRSWDDAIVTGMTPAPSGRCPFEPFH